MEAGTEIRMSDAATGSTTMADLALKAADKHADKIAARHKSGDEWVDITYREFGERVQNIALGLMDLGIQKGDRVAILAHTRPEWAWACYGILTAGGVSVSIYQTNSPEECHYVLEHSESRAVFVEDEEQLAKIRAIRGSLPSL